MRLPSAWYWSPIRTSTDPPTGPVAIGSVAFRAVFQRSPTPMLIADDSRRYVAANAAACRLLGVSPDEIIGRTIDEFTGSQDAGNVRNYWRDFLAVGTMTGSYQLKLRSGAELTVDFSAFANIGPGRHLAILVATDGTPAPLPPPASEHEALSPREREVMGLLARGESVAGIASRLGIAQDTVRNHIRAARRKLGARTRDHAVALAVGRGEIEL